MDAISNLATLANCQSLTCSEEIVLLFPNHCNYKLTINDAG